MKNIAENLWLFHYKLPLLGDYLGRNVTVIRLGSGDLIIHSTAPFTPEDVAEIKTLGNPAYLVEADSKHDTFAQKGHEAFPDIPYLAPAGFGEVAEVPTQPLSNPPAAWQGEVDVLELGGKGGGEYVMLHRPSRTLIVTDLVFNIEGDAPTAAKILSPLLQVGAEPEGAGMPRLEKLSVKDPEAFRSSLNTLWSWDFDRIIVGHGDPVEFDAKSRLQHALEGAGF